MSFGGTVVRDNVGGSTFQADSIRLAVHLKRRQMANTSLAPIFAGAAVTTAAISLVIQAYVILKNGEVNHLGFVVTFIILLGSSFRYRRSLLSRSKIAN